MLGTVALVLLTAGKAPIAFSPTLGADPMGTQSKLTSLEGKLPASFALPATLQTLTSRQVTASFFPEMQAALLRAQNSGPGLMAWPTATVVCPKHVAFAFPTNLLVAQPSAACTAAATALQQQVTSTACRDVEQPERYALAYAPPQVNNTTTASIESLIGLAGEGLGHHLPPTNLLPADWVPTLRSVIWKLRAPAITAQLAQARTQYAQASAALTTNAACFDATARAALAAELTALDGELAAAQTRHATLIAQGTARAQQDVTCLGAKARTRPALPFPALTDDERRFVAFWLGGVYWRMRGGGLLPLGSTQNARTYFCEKPLRRIGDLAGGIVGEETGYRIFLNIFDGWGEWMDMHTTAGGQDLYEDLVEMTERGRHQVADGPFLGTQQSGVKYLTDRGYDPTALFVGGMDMGPCYLLGLDPLGSFRYADQATAPYGPFIEAFTAVGEFCTGASISLGLATSLLGGTPSGLPATNLCSGKQCGDDGCGGSCGTCAGSNVCVNSQCVSPVPDAGPTVVVDAGTDAGLDARPPPVDAGTSKPDAGPQVDAGSEPAAVDAGAAQPIDAGDDRPPPVMVPLRPEPPAPGCGCTAGGPGVLLFALALVALRRRADQL